MNSEASVTSARVVEWVEIIWASILYANPPGPGWSIIMVRHNDRRWTTTDLSSATMSHDAGHWSDRRPVTPLLRAPRRSSQDLVQRTRANRSPLERRQLPED